MFRATKTQAFLTVLIAALASAATYRASADIVFHLSPTPDGFVQIDVQGFGVSKTDAFNGAIGEVGILNFNHPFPFNVNETLLTIPGGIEFINHTTGENGGNPSLRFLDRSFGQGLFISFITSRLNEGDQLEIVGSTRTYDGELSGLRFDDIDISGLSPVLSGLPGTVSVDGGDFSPFDFGDAYITVIPEPSTAMMTLAVAGLFLRRRRRVENSMKMPRRSGGAILTAATFALACTGLAGQTAEAAPIVEGFESPDVGTSTPSVTSFEGESGLLFETGPAAFLHVSDTNTTFGNGISQVLYNRSATDAITITYNDGQAFTPLSFEAGGRFNTEGSLTSVFELEGGGTQEVSWTLDGTKGLETLAIPTLTGPAVSWTIQDTSVNLFYDNFTVVPEPASMGLLAGGLVLVLRRRSRPRIA